MAEDPGVGTLSAAIEAMRQLFNFVQDTAKSIVNTGADGSVADVGVSRFREAPLKAARANGIPGPDGFGPSPRICAS